LRKLELQMARTKALLSADKSTRLAAAEALAADASPDVKRC
jgi:hypothetical protein